ncbi:hypothetical protein NZ698_14865 [Chryseobacterium sp. PBS4-4]|uniref:DUF4365 domain-containing protein n=1 Tax=Chryseobacterium edaphi TaxID=2976532 RepID=A0ABT2W909_9FLAO|nr:hypothetical protein [Chryseobacterium edaphi]MCU7618480.1 hypothetical protein [Chryseobacterium edaphi]
MKFDNDHIRKEADDLLKGTLRNLLFQMGMKLKEHSASAGEDNGTDFYFDVTNEKNEHIFFFRNQNKGTNDHPKVLKKKKDVHYHTISHQISLRNAINYYNEFDEAIIFTLCDLTTKQVYWYDLQNDPSLKERIEIQKDKGSNFIRLYIPAVNFLNEDTLAQFLDHIETSKLAQIRKKKFLSDSTQSDYAIVEEEIKSMHIIDKIDHTLKLFDIIYVLPPNVISSLPPFKGSDENITNLDGFTFYTDNEEFFDLIDSIILSDNEIKLNSDEIFVEDQNRKLKDITTFLSVNYINHIIWRGKSPKNRICVHNLFQYGICDCERCSLEKLNIKKAKELLEDKKEEDILYITLRKGYAYYLMGNYKEAFDVFFNIYNETDRANNPIKYTVLTYNLIRLRRLIKWSYIGSDEQDILEKLSKINFDFDEPWIRKKTPYFLDVFKYIKDEKFYDEARDSLDSCFSEIQKISFSDKYGSSFSSNRYDELKSSFLRLNSFLKYNFLIFKHYSNYEDFAKKVLECIFALYTLKNPITEKYQKFDWSIIEMWIFSIDEKHSVYLLEKYGLSKINFNEQFDIFERINDLILNLIYSCEQLESISGIYKPIKINRILSNILVIVQLLEISYESKSQVFENILLLAKMVKGKYNIPFDHLIRFVEKNEDNILKDQVRELLDVLINEDRNYSFGRLINIYVEKSTNEEIEDLIKEVLKIDDLFKIDVDLDKRYIKKLFYSFTFLKDEFKNDIKLKITESLEKNFSNELYQYATIYDLIEYDDKLFEVYTSHVPDMSDESQEQGYGFYDNIMIGQIINLAFKYNLEFSNELKKLIKKSHPKYSDYYTWLMNIDSFDYSKFDPYWILEYRTIYYFERFKKSDILKKELVQCLKENYIEGVAKIYFKELV